MVLFWLAPMASDRSVPTFFASTSNAATNSMSLNVVRAEHDVHQAGDLGVRVGIGVVMHPLNEGRGAVAHADDGDTDLAGGSGLRCEPIWAPPSLAVMIASGSCVRPRSARTASEPRGRPTRDRARAVAGCSGRPAPRRVSALRQAFALLLHPAAATLEDLQPDVGPGLGEERQPGAEAFLVEGIGTNLGQQFGQVLLALGGQAVDPLAPPGAGRATVAAIRFVQRRLLGKPTGFGQPTKVGYSEP